MIPIVQQLPARYPHGRCLVVGLTTSDALIITEDGTLSLWPLSDITVDWHYSATEGQFVGDFEEEYLDEKVDDIPEVPGELHQSDGVSDRDP